MKRIGMMLGITAILLTGMSECQKADIQTANVKAEITVLSKCEPALGLPILKEVREEEAVIEQRIREARAGVPQQIYYLVKYPFVPTGYLTVCNLPDDCKKDGLRIKFSSVIFKLEYVEFQNRDSIPAEFSSVQRLVEN